MKRQFRKGWTILTSDNEQHLDTLFLFTGAFVGLILIGFGA